MTTRPNIRQTIRAYAGAKRKQPFQAIELTLARLMSDKQARESCAQLCSEGELRRVERGVYCATRRLRV